jgi:hypothetical protein
MSLKVMGAVKYITDKINEKLNKQASEKDYLINLYAFLKCFEKEEGCNNEEYLEVWTEISNEISIEEPEKQTKTIIPKIRDILNNLLESQKVDDLKKDLFNFFSENGKVDYYKFLVAISPLYYDYFNEGTIFAEKIDNEITKMEKIIAAENKESDSESEEESEEGLEESEEEFEVPKQRDIYKTQITTIAEGMQSMSPNNMLDSIFTMSGGMNSVLSSLLNYCKDNKNMSDRIKALQLRIQGNPLTSSRKISEGYKPSVIQGIVQEKTLEQLKKEKRDIENKYDDIDDASPDDKTKLEELRILIKLEKERKTRSFGKVGLQSNREMMLNYLFGRNSRKGKRHLKKLRRHSKDIRKITQKVHRHRRSRDFKGITDKHSKKMFKSYKKYLKHKYITEEKNKRIPKKYKKSIKKNLKKIQKKIKKEVKKKIRRRSFGSDIYGLQPVQEYTGVYPLQDSSNNPGSVMSHTGPNFLPNLNNVVRDYSSSSCVEGFGNPPRRGF